jgi:hypothetical protein
MTIAVAIPSRAVIEDARRRQRRRRFATGTALLGLALALVLLLRPWSPGPGTPGAATSAPASRSEREPHAAHGPVAACVGPQHRLAISPPSARVYAQVVARPIRLLLTQITLHRLGNGTFAGLCLYAVPARR